MSNKMLKNLIYDMSIMIQAHNLEQVDPYAKIVLQRADLAVSSRKDSEFLVKDHAQMIEAIRQDNLHPYAA